MNEAGIYIFNDETDFLNVMATIKSQCNTNQSQSRFIYLKHHLTTFDDVKKQIQILKMFKLLCFSGFMSEKLIKVCVSDLNGNKYNITYSFNNSGVYTKLHHYLRKREKVFI